LLDSIYWHSGLLRSGFRQTPPAKQLDVVALCGLLLVMPFYTWRVGANVYVCLLMHACECQPRPIPIHLRYLQLYLCAAMRRLCVCRLISITKPAQLTCYHNWRT